MSASFRGHLSEESFLRLLQLALKARGHGRRWLRVGLLSALFVACGYLYARAAGVLALPLFAVPVALLALAWRVQRMQRRAYAEEAAFRDELSGSIDDDGVTLTTALGTTRWPWSALKSYTSGEAGIVVFQTSLKFLPLDRSFFTDADWTQALAVLEPRLRRERSIRGALFLWLIALAALIVVLLALLVAREPRPCRRPARTAPSTSEEL